MRLLLASLLALLAPRRTRAEEPVFVQSQAYLDGAYGPYPMQHYHTVSLDVPRVDFARWSEEHCVDDTRAYVLAIHGGTPVPGAWPCLLSTRGALVWTVQPFGLAVGNLAVQSLRGAPVLTYWVGQEIQAHGAGVYHILDDAYELQHVVAAGNGLDADNHELSITDDGTALLTAYALAPSPWDLAAVGFQPTPRYNASLFGRPMKQVIWDSVFQEISIDNGSVLFEWRASQHFALNAMSVNAFAPYDYEMTGGYDYFHINAVTKDRHGNYLISSRYNSGVSYISGASGAVLWTLGGKRNNFTGSAAATEFWCQHMVRFVQQPSTNLAKAAAGAPRGTAQLTLFDNGEFWGGKLRPSRGVHVQLDFDRMTAVLLREYQHPEQVWAESQGSMMLAPAMGASAANASIAVLGYGYAPVTAVFDAAGTLQCDMRIASLAHAHREPNGFTQNVWGMSYRSLLQSWVGRPRTLPDTAIARSLLWVSWNGATEVRVWRLRGLDKAGKSVWEQTAEKMGFETPLRLPGAEVAVGRFVVAALGKGDEVLGEWDMDHAGRLSVAGNKTDDAAHETKPDDKTPDAAHEKKPDAAQKQPQDAAVKQSQDAAVKQPQETAVEQPPSHHQPPSGEIVLVALAIVALLAVAMFLLYRRVSRLELVSTSLPHTHAPRYTKEDTIGGFEYAKLQDADHD